MMPLPLMRLLFALSLPVVTTLPGPPAHACQPSTLGSPCAQGGPALMPPSEPAFNLGAGNPIHLVTGNKYQYDLDLPASPYAPGLEIARHYNAQDPRPSVLGPGWALSYEARLHRVGDGWQIAQPDGSRIQFASRGGRPLANRHGRLRAKGSHWVWVWPTGKKLTFDQEGRLIGIEFPERQTITIKRHHDTSRPQRGHGPLHGAIERISHSSGATVSLHYRVYGGQAYLSRANSAAGQFDYAYEAISHPAPAHGTEDHSRAVGDKLPVATSGKAARRRLASLTRPDGMQRLYLYEPRFQAGNPFHITGIVIVSADGRQRKRTNTWAYDKTGRAILSIQGPPASSAGKVRIEYPRTPNENHDGLTIVTNAAGDTSRFVTAIRGGRYVLLDSSGAGCTGCPAPGNQAHYDHAGRLLQVNTTRITRDTGGAIQSIEVADSGWPALTMHYQSNGRRRAWHSSVTDTETTQYDALRRPVRRHFANGDLWRYNYDTRGRPIRVQETHAGKSWTTTLAWQGRRLTRVNHPYQRETRRYDSQGRLARRTIVRSIQAEGPRQPQKGHHQDPQRYGYSYSESFSYDRHHNLIRHNLPEGGALAYARDKHGQLRHIDWTDRQGRTHRVVTRESYGYRYGNGLDLLALYKKGRASDLIVTSRDEIILAASRRYDKQGRLAQERHIAPGHDYSQTWHYAYDDRGRMSGARQSTRRLRTQSGPAADAAMAADQDKTTVTEENATWYAWRKDGSLAARLDDGRTTGPSIQRDPSGLPIQADGIDLEYGPNRRPAQASRNGVALSAYRYNAFGQRISSIQAGWRTDYFYLGNKVVAQSRHPVDTDQSARFNGHAASHHTSATDPRPHITRRYIYAAHVLVGIIDYAPRPEPPDGLHDNGGGKSHADKWPHGASGVLSARLYAVHTDMLGAPRALTDANRNVRWLASYTPTGQATRILGDLTLNVRLPGQMLDPATGWHDNLLRTYNPRWGHYQEPDPLGPIPANQAFGYARQQPRRYIDPLGLLLFAFDGTRNNAQTQTNVWKMAQLYRDGPVFYQAGPGNPASLDWDAITAYSAPDILAAQWALLLNALAQPGSIIETIPIDIIGFSRGAALARHFANQINNYVVNGLFSYTDARRGAISACIDLRFMGLFDTVAQFGLMGAQDANYDLTIAAAWEWVAHAVALHERRWLFPLTSVESGGVNTVEAPFIGAHADIGGGIALDEDGHAGSRGDLADVALNWMLWQAHAASVPLGPNDTAAGEITAPILHDERSPFERSSQNVDRRIDAPDGTKRVTHQDDDDDLGRKQRQAAEQLITRIKGWRRANTTEVGTVDMTGYARWLHDELGWQALPA